MTVVFQETDLLLIKCNYYDSKDAKVFQEQTRLFGNKKVESIIGLHIQGPYATSKCSTVRSTVKYRSTIGVLHCLQKLIILNITLNEI